MAAGATSEESYLPAREPATVKKFLLSPSLEQSITLDVFVTAARSLQPRHSLNLPTYGACRETNAWNKEAMCSVTRAGRVSVAYVHRRPVSLLLVSSVDQCLLLVCSIDQEESMWTTLMLPLHFSGLYNTVLVGLQFSPLLRLAIGTLICLLIGFGNALSIQRRNTKAGEVGNPRENPPTSGIVQPDSHLQKAGMARQGLNSGRNGGSRAC
ncbi:hypothetical protein PR048_024180 [Dryococelus australis]|uniref:Uncharacterized protein n=1 Tax=Dryococelus australis TaxID=614101 RepID=A0ABQ9GW52_9NEOP|nr:hypothetical protein PR048_024180 [Dryococelus australis]